MAVTHRDFYRLIEALTERIGRLASYLILAIVFNTTLEVTLRYVFNSPTSYAWPLNRQLFGVFILFAGAYAIKDGAHIRIEIFYQHFSPVVKSIARTIALMAMIAFLGVLVWQSTWMGLNSLEMGEKAAGAFRIPLYPFKLLIPLAALLFLLEGIVVHFKKK